MFENVLLFMGFTSFFNIVDQFFPSIISYNCFLLVEGKGTEFYVYLKFGRFAEFLSSSQEL